MKVGKWWKRALRLGPAPPSATITEHFSFDVALGEMGITISFIYFKSILSMLALVTVLQMGLSIQLFDSQSSADVQMED